MSLKNYTIMFNYLDSLHFLKSGKTCWLSIKLILCCIIFVFTGCVSSPPPTTIQSDTTASLENRINELQQLNKRLKEELANNSNNESRNTELLVENAVLRKKLNNALEKSVSDDKELQKLRAEIESLNKRMASDDKKLKKLKELKTGIEKSNKESTPITSGEPPVTPPIIDSPPPGPPQVTINNWSLDKKLSPAAADYNSALKDCKCRKQELPPKSILFQAADNGEIKLSDQGEWADSVSTGEAVVVQYGNKSVIVYKNKYKLKYRCARRIK